MDNEKNAERPSRIVVFISQLCTWFFGPAIVVFGAEVAYVLTRGWIVQKLSVSLSIADLSIALLSLMCIVIAIGGFAKAWTNSASEQCIDKSTSAWSMAVRLFFILFVVSTLLVFAYTAIVKVAYPDITHRGAFGDTFGALNSIVSTVALIGLWLTIWLQYRQIQLDRDRSEENRRFEERKRAEDRTNARRRSWPAVVVEKLEGIVKLSGVDRDGNATFRFVFEVGQKNCSDQVLINVVQNLKTSRNSSNEYIVNLSTEVERYVERGGPIEATATFIEKTFGGEGTVNALTKCESRIVHVNIYMCTVQKDYYFISHQFELKIKDDENSSRVLTAWMDALAVIKERVSKKMAVNDLNKLLTDMLARKGISSDAELGLVFRSLPNRYKFDEIREDEYLNVLGDFVK